MMETISGLSLAFLLIWGIPTFVIAYEKFIPRQERKLWIIANLFFPWVAFLVFLVGHPARKLQFLPVAQMGKLTIHPGFIKSAGMSSGGRSMESRYSCPASAGAAPASGARLPAGDSALQTDSAMASSPQ